jgi:2-oxoisovalerate dehydrogenase E1 component beta subunit
MCCSTPQDAYSMLRQAIACDDPVIFYEPKRRYWSKGVVDTHERGLDADRANVVRPGRDVTIVTYGGMVATCLAAAEASDSVDVEVIDLRSLSPLDLEAVARSVERTGRCVVVHEAPTFLGLGAEIGAAVTERCFYYLQAPVLRVGGYNTPYPPALLEDEYLPDLDRVLDAVERAMAW